MAFLLTRATALLTAMMMTAPASMAGATGIGDCPLDRVTFVDSKSGRQFVAKRVAERSAYMCKNDFKKELWAPAKAPAGCEYIYGETFVEGSLDGKKVLAVFAASTGSVPCCNWYSYGEKEAQGEAKNAKWLKHAKVPTMSSLGDSPSMASEIQDKGPLGDGEFIGTTCRTTD